MTIETPEKNAPVKATESERTKNLAKAYQSANAQLRNAHREEFNAFYQAAAKELGEEWTPRPNAQEKARQDLLALLQAHPELADEVAERITK